MILVPEKCLICGSKWRGGAQVPGEKLKPKVRVFYNCGASLSYKSTFEGCYQILISNCSKNVFDKIEIE